MEIGRHHPRPLVLEVVVGGVYVMVHGLEGGFRAWLYDLIPFNQVETCLAPGVEHFLDSPHLGSKIGESSGLVADSYYVVW